MLWLDLARCGPVVEHLATITNVLSKISKASPKNKPDTMTHYLSSHRSYIEVKIKMPTNRFVLRTSFWCSVKILDFASFSSGGMNTKSVDFSSSKSLLLLNFGDEDSNFSCGFLKRCEFPDYFLIFLCFLILRYYFNSDYTV